MGGCAIGYEASIGDPEETADQEIGDAQRDVDQEIGELEREGDEMEERLDAIGGDEVDPERAANPAEASEAGVDETDVPEGEGESAEEAGQ